jgi:leucyl/phenylalanyl-tRNA--protein transferase
VLSRVFGPPGDWPDQDLIGFSDEFDADLTLAAYRSGVFPMPLHLYEHEAEMSWWSPKLRGIIELPDLRVSRSLRQSAKRYWTSVDRAFDAVLARCSDPDRPDGWIDTKIAEVYTRLNQAGFVHSIETWDESGNLVGGLYGVSIAALFAGESMFHDPSLGRDASKVALVRLVRILQSRPDNQALLDVQWVTDHLSSLGATEIPREHYLHLLDFALSQPETDWPKPEDSLMKGWG